MEEKIVNIINEMADYLNIAQIKKLQEVLVNNLETREPEKQNVSNNEYLQMFLNAKKSKGVLNGHYNIIR